MIDTNKLKLVKLINGDELIGEVVDGGQYKVLILNPLLLEVYNVGGGSSLTMKRYGQYCGLIENSILIEIPSILYISKLKKVMVDHYLASLEFIEKIIDHRIDEDLDAGTKEIRRIIKKYENPDQSPSETMPSASDPLELNIEGFLGSTPKTKH